MSKDDTCKVTSASKHKERKPKKPHYIPRPWGKPYNYKCFQCPFTCMEKSHLYNHMKYSLCKNSLSLLIESDWPYKKGNILHPEQLRPFQHGLHAAGKDEAEQAARAEERRGQRRSAEEEGEDRENRAAEEEEEGGAAEGTASNGGTAQREPSKKSRDEGRKGKQPENPELLVADMLTLEEQLLRARSVEVEAQLKHYKLSKTCLTAPGLLSEQWRLLASGQGKAKTEGAPPRVNSSIPCYPPPPNLVDYQDPSGLNLSVLGVGYPISPGLFSYMNSAMSAPTAGVTAQAHAQLAQLPFLASAAQLMHPASGVDRALIPPRLYYPFLCEHSFGSAAAQSEAAKALKTPPSGLEANPLAGFQPKVNLWKVPALRPGATAGSPVGWVSPQRDAPVEQGFRSAEKAQAAAKEGKGSWGVKRTGAPLGNQEAPAEKRTSMGFTMDLLKNIQTASSLNMAADKLLFQSSLQEAPLPTRPSELWYSNSLTSPKSETSSVSTCLPVAQDQTPARTTGDDPSEPVSSLLSDLSKALQEYQEAERKISHLEKEDLPAQRHLWDHLSKIRSELSHIHQALERTARQSDGPLDLSVKRDSANTAGEPREGAHALRDAGTETDEEDEELEERREGEEDEDEEEEDEEESQRKAMKASLESRKQSLDMLIKMSQASVMSAEVLSSAALGMRPSPAEALWPSRATKCEADSSVLLCPDGRSVVFADIPSKNSKRPASIQRLEAQCPPSPLTAADN